jgi:NET1-associated nuclear protein 1 (U3 small nucleolar RNA-associated protein 17)
VHPRLPIIHTLLGSRETPPAPATTPLAVHALSATVILPSSHPSSLQTYSPSRSRLVAELEVAPSNRVSRRESKALEPSRVELAAVSPSGEWMATVDTRIGDDSFRGEAYLKIWQWDKGFGFWLLNSRIDRPHGLMKVTSASFSPKPLSLLVTTGQDGNIKTWTLRTVRSKKKDSSECKHNLTSLNCPGGVNLQ